MVEAGTILERNDRVEHRGLAEEGGVLLHLDTAQYHGVNSIGALVWELLNDVTFGELLAELRLRLLDVPETFDEEIAEFLEELIDRDLIRAVASP